MIRRTEEWGLDAPRAEDVLLLGAVVLLPWAFGGVELWAQRPAAFFLVASAAVVAIRDGWGTLLPGFRERWLWAAFFLAAWAAMQLVPLPPAVLKVASPGAYRIQAETVPWYPGDEPGDSWADVESSVLDRVPEAAAIPPAGVSPEEEFRPDPVGDWHRWRPISLHAAATAERLFWYLALLAGFLVVRLRARQPEVYRLYQVAMFAAFSALAVAGIAQILHWNGKVLWIRETLTGGRPMGPYVNATHFGGVMELAAPWLAGYAWSRIRTEGWQALKKAQAPLALGACGLCVAAGFLSASKMAAASLVVSLSVLVLVCLSGWKNRVIALGCLVVTWSLALVGLFQTTLGDRVMDFLEGSGGALTHYNRLVVWKSSVPIFLDYPFTGVGFGAFRQVFPHYIPAGEAGSWLRVHNDFFEVLLDGGLIAAVLVVWITAGFWLSVASGAAAGRGSGTSNPSRVGLILGLLALTVHAAVDFNHQIPANALLFVTASAMLLASSAPLARRTG